MTDTNNSNDNVPIRHAFSYLFAATSVSSLGAAVSLVSVNWIVYHYTQSALDISYVGLAGIIPGIALGLLAGVLADRYNRRTIMVISDLARMALIGMLALALYLYGFSLLVILLVIVAANSFTSLFLPASQALIPRLVDRSGLERANGLLQGTQAAMLSIGSALGGLVIVFGGAVIGLGINSLTYLLSAVFLIQISGKLGMIPLKAGHEKMSMFGDLKVGISFMVEHREILELTLVFLPANFFSFLVETFVVVYAAVHFGSDPTIYGYLAAGISLGIVLGALSVEPIHGRRFAGWLMGESIILSGGAVYLLVLSHVEILAIVGTVIAGIAVGLINTTFMSTIQAIVPDETLARVLGVDAVGSFAAIPAGIAVGGILISRYGVDLTFTVAALGLVTNGIVALMMKGFRTLKYIE